jgi:hypothetical protein
LENCDNLELAEIKITDADFEELTETVICGKKVGIIVYLDSLLVF